MNTLKAHLAVLAILLTSAAGAFAAGEATYLTRAGLYGNSEFVSTDGAQVSTIQTLTGSGDLFGSSQRYADADDAGWATWAMSGATGITARIGLSAGAEYTDSFYPFNYQYSNIDQVTTSGFARGYSQRYTLSDALGSTYAGQAAWVANATTGVTVRVGFFDLDYTKYDGVIYTNGYQYSQANSLNSSGYAAGSSSHFDENAAYLGESAWTANGTTGATTRIGLFSDPEFTAADGRQDTSSFSGITESGYVGGVSSRYNGTNSDLGSGTWVANATTGITTRTGLTGAGYTFDGYQNSTFGSINESGQSAGTSSTYTDSEYIGEAVWVADASGTTTRVGLFSGSEFHNTALLVYSGIDTNITADGYVSGVSYRYSGGSNDAGQATWIANANTGVTTRIGLFTGSEFTSTTDDYQYSVTQRSTRSGYYAGSSNRYDGSLDVGTAQWVANGATGVTTRVGLYSGPEFTRANDGTQGGSVNVANEGGYFAGLSDRYNGDISMGTAIWVANGATGETKRFGLTSSEFTRDDGSQFGAVTILTDSGYMAGLGNRYIGAVAKGKGAWVASFASGVTTRVGLFTDPEFTRADGFQTSNVSDLTESGYAGGTSTRFDGSSISGIATWVAKDGETYRVGLTDAAHTGDGITQFSSFSTNVISGGQITEEGYAGGYSLRFDDAGAQTGQTAWVFDLNTLTEVDFDLSLQDGSGYGYSVIDGITDGGLAFGSYTLFDIDGSSLGNRAFIWRSDFGTLQLDQTITGGVGQYDWESFDYTTFMNSQGILVGLGTPTGIDPALGSGVYVVQLQGVPEPSTWALLLVALGALAFFYRRRQKA